MLKLMSRSWIEDAASITNNFVANKLSTNQDKEIACQDQLVATKPESQTSRHLAVVQAQRRHRGCRNEGISFIVVKLPKFVESTAWTVFHQQL
jgi:hypothetical protein